jgi:hypothetical protein
MRDIYQHPQVFGFLQQFDPKMGQPAESAFLPRRKTATIGCVISTAPRQTDGANSEPVENRKQSQIVTERVDTLKGYYYPYLPSGINGVDFRHTRTERYFIRLFLFLQHERAYLIESLAERHFRQLPAVDEKRRHKTVPPSGANQFVMPVGINGLRALFSSVVQIHRKIKMRVQHKSIGDKFFSLLYKTFRHYFDFP